MIITRIYTGDDGQSHMEDFDLSDHANPESLMSVSSIVFRSHDPGRFSDWHCESRRNYIITVSGEGEIGLGDGSVHRICPGRVMLVEDLTVQATRRGLPAAFQISCSRLLPVAILAKC